MADSEAMDDVAFEAAMASFLHEFNLITDKVTLGISPDSHGPQKAAQSKLKATERRDRYRKKLQNERETLRRQERELSTKLTHLQEAQAREKELEKTRNTLALSAWRATAARQKEKRLEVENEQQRLKAAVRSRAEAIRRMSVMLTLSAPMTASEEQVDAQGALLFKTFIGELESLYDRTDYFVKDSMEQVPPENFALKRKRREDQMLLESAGATEIPVAFEPTWRCLSSILLLDPQGTHYTGEIDDPENTAAIMYRLNDGSGDTAQLVVYNAVRRYIEKDRVVFVWRVLFEGQGELDGLYADEHAWLVVRSSGSVDNPGTTLKNFSQLKPMRIDGHAASSDSRSLRFVKLLQKSDEEDIADIKQLMQRMLLSESAPPSESAPGSDVVMELNL